MKPANERKFNKWSYFLAWVSFMASVALALRDVLKEKKPPAANDYTE